MEKVQCYCPGDCDTYMAMSVALRIKDGMNADLQASLHESQGFRIKHLATIVRRENQLEEAEEERNVAKGKYSDLLKECSGYEERIEELENRYEGTMPVRKRNVLLNAENNQMQAELAKAEKVITALRECNKFCGCSTETDDALAEYDKD